jgi:hypothetical protein
MRKIQKPKSRTKGSRLLRIDHEVEDPVLFASNATPFSSSNFWSSYADWSTGYTVVLVRPVLNRKSTACVDGWNVTWAIRLGSCRTSASALLNRRLSEEPFESFASV